MTAPLEAVSNYIQIQTDETSILCSEEDTLSWRDVGSLPCAK